MTDTMLDMSRVAHRDDPDTSHTAAANLAGTEAVKLAILTLLRESTDGLTAFEAQDRYIDQRAARGWPQVQPHSINRRMSDMHKETPARVRDTSRRRPTPSGATAVVWSVSA